MSAINPIFSPAKSGRSSSSNVLWTCLGLIVLSIVGAGIVVDRHANSIARAVHKIAQVEEPMSAAAYEMEINVLGRGLEVLKYLQSGDAIHRARAADDAEDFARYKMQFDRLAAAPREKDLSRRLDGLHAEYQSVGEQTMAIKDEQRAVSQQMTRKLARVDRIVDTGVEPRLNWPEPGRSEVIQLLNDIEADIAEAGSWLGNYLQTREIGYRTQAATSIEEVRGHVLRLRALTSPGREQEAVPELETTVLEALLQMEQLFALDDSVRKNQEHFVALRIALDNLLDEEIQARAIQHLKSAENSALGAVQWLRWTNLALCGGLVATLLAASAVLWRSGQLAAVNVQLRDLIAERGKAEQARTRLMERLVSAQEMERRRLARELHDQMGQQLSAIMIELKGIETAATPSATEVFRRTGKARALTEEAIRDAHSIAWELRPAMLDDLGLQSALTRYIDRWTERTGIVADFLPRLDDARLPSHIETTLYRVAQEALQNVFKHAGATEVSVILERHRQEVRLVVEDNGRGFDELQKKNGAPGEDGLGLSGMRERVLLAGGALEIESRPGAGVTVAARIPFGAGEANYSLPNG